MLDALRDRGMTKGGTVHYIVFFIRFMKCSWQMAVFRA
jgi:hypothetical protein